MEDTMKMLNVDSQRAIEFTYGRKHINSRITKAIKEDSYLMSKVEQGCELLKEWLESNFYESKNKRLEPLQLMDHESVVTTVFNIVAYCQTPELFTSVTGMLAATFNLEEKIENIKTAAEILAVLCNTDAYDILKNNTGNLVIQCKFGLPQALIESIERSHYLPPMIFKPNRLKDNFTSPYLTLDKDCLILGRGNAHTGDLCLDVLNIQNSVELKLDYEFIQSLTETPPSEPDTDQILNWKTFLKQSKEVYDLIHFHGDEFFMPYKVDKRGRIYSLGYHINPQGYAYKKAMIELANPEFIEVPL